MKEINEVGVSEITIAISLTRNRTSVPAGGAVKFFEDELGHTWCKFSTAPPTVKQEVVQHVHPAWRVVEVQYRKGEFPC